MQQLSRDYLLVLWSKDESKTRGGTDQVDEFLDKSGLEEVFSLIIKFGNDLLAIAEQRHNFAETVRTATWLDAGTQQHLIQEYSQRERTSCSPKALYLFTPRLGMVDDDAVNWEQDLLDDRTKQLIFCDTPVTDFKTAPYSFFQVEDSSEKGKPGSHGDYNPEGFFGVSWVERIRNAFPVSKH